MAARAALLGAADARLPAAHLSADASALEKAIRLKPASEGAIQAVSASAFVLEVLHGALVFFGRGARRERAEVSPLAGLRIYFARIETILA